MAKLRKHNNTMTVSGVKLNQADMLLLDSGGELDVHVSTVDQRYITDQQRRFIFALCGIVEYQSGIDSEYFRATVMTIYNNVYGLKLESLTQYSMTNANQLIDLIITTMIEKQIPIEGDLLKQNEFNFNADHTYLLCLKRTCVICGKRADLHHVDTVGMGMDRKKISHVGKRMLPLCRVHHNEAHTRGDKTFIERYHLEPTIIDKKLEHFIKTGKVRVFE